MVKSDLFEFIKIIFRLNTNGDCQKCNLHLFNKITPLVWIPWENKFIWITSVLLLEEMLRLTVGSVIEALINCHERSNKSYLAVSIKRFKNDKVDNYTVIELLNW